MEGIFVKKALITGITGQDGSYLAELLIGKGYEVHGIVRRTSTFNRERIEHIFKVKVPLFLHYADMSDQISLIKVIENTKPDEIYNLAAQSHVKVSFEQPEYTASSDALGVLRILEAVKSLHLIEKTKVYQASTSEMYGGEQAITQDEKTPFLPKSPYAAAKLYGYWVSAIYREAYGIFVCNGILFNHESSRRGESFVTRKITLGVSRIARQLQDWIVLGNLDSRRDWGFAPEYVEAMWLMLQQPTADDYVIATGETHTVREFVEEAFGHTGVTIQWKGTGLDETGIDSKTGKTIVKISKDYYRPIDVDYLQGNADKAKRLLGWQPKTTFRELVRIMMEKDMTRIGSLDERFSYFT
jgi:GDPmannose 4,6-dehydratase